MPALSHTAPVPRYPRGQISASCLTRGSGILPARVRSFTSRTRDRRGCGLRPCLARPVQPGARGCLTYRALGRDVAPPSPDPSLPSSLLPPSRGIHRRYALWGVLAGARRPPRGASSLDMAGLQHPCFRPAMTPPAPPIGLSVIFTIVARRRCRTQRRPSTESASLEPPGRPSSLGGTFARLRSDPPKTHRPPSDFR